MKTGHGLVVAALIASLFAAAPAQARQFQLDWSAVFAEETLDEVPRRLSCPTLEYPRELQQAGIQGSVHLRFVVDTTGRVEPSSVEVLSSTHKAFEEPATTMIRGCRFRPGRIRARAVRTLVPMPINFRLTPPQDVRPTTTVVPTKPKVLRPERAAVLGAPSGS